MPLRPAGKRSGGRHRSPGSTGRPAGGSAGSSAQGSPKACDHPEPGVEAPPAPSHSDRARDHATADRREGGCPGFCAALCPPGQQLDGTVLTTRPEAPSRFFPARPLFFVAHGSCLPCWCGWSEHFVRTPATEAGVDCQLSLSTPGA